MSYTSPNIVTSNQNKFIYCARVADTKDDEKHVLKSEVHVSMNQYWVLCSQHVRITYTVVLLVFMFCIIVWVTLRIQHLNSVKNVYVRNECIPYWIFNLTNPFVKSIVVEIQSNLTAHSQINVDFSISP